MEKFNKNKENVSQNRLISDMFKVKKCLFDQSQQKDTESSSPNLALKYPADSPMVESPSIDDSPFSMFKIKKRNSASSSKVSPMVESPNIDDSPFSLFKVKKRNSASSSKVILPVDYTASGSIVTTPTNKKYEKEEVDDNVSSFLYRSSNEVKLAVQKAILNPNLTGDFSKPCSLPTIQGRHPDLKTVSPAMVASLIRGSVSFTFSLIDCRYPYEYNAGHIKNAQNVYMKEDIVKMLLGTDTTSKRIESKEVLIFYCEFSSERGPSMLRHLRNSDRDVNRDFYPFLYYPELYVMEGGYKSFFSNFKELCDPQEYKRMLDKDCADELAYYKSKCKSMNRSSKRLKRTRSSLVF